MDQHNIRRVELAEQTQEIISKIYENTNAVTSPAFIVGWYGAAAVVGSAGLAAEGLWSSGAIEQGVQTAMANGMARAMQAQAMYLSLRTFMLNVVSDPKNIAVVTDFVNGLTPTPPPLSDAGWFAYFLSNLELLLDNLEAPPPEIEMAAP